MLQRRIMGICAVSSLTLAAAAATAGRAHELPRPDASGRITLLAPCDDNPPKDDFKNMTAVIQKTLKLTKSDIIFASTADVTSDADGSVFSLSLKVEQGGSVVSSGQSKKTLDKGKSGSLATFCGVLSATGNYQVSAVLRREPDGPILDSKKCDYTAP